MSEDNLNEYIREEVIYTSELGSTSDDSLETVSSRGRESDSLVKKPPQSNEDSSFIIRNNGELLNGQLAKSKLIAVDVLEWTLDEVRFAVEGKLLYTQPTDSNWKKRATIKLAPINALLVTLGKPTDDYQPDSDEPIVFPRSNGIKVSTLVLMKEKGGRFSLLRESLFLDRCIICTEADVDDYFEVQELPTKESYIFKAEDSEMTRRWYRQLQYHAQGAGSWRRRRNALANIMINGMINRA